MRKPRFLLKVSCERGSLGVSKLQSVSITEWMGPLLLSQDFPTHDSQAIDSTSALVACLDLKKACTTLKYTTVMHKPSPPPDNIVYIHHLPHTIIIQHRKFDHCKRGIELVHQYASIGVSSMVCWCCRAREIEMFLVSSERWWCYWYPLALLM